MKELALEHLILKAGARGWILYFLEASTMFLWPPSILLSIASRETNMENIPGDFHEGKHHGYGVMQIDIRSRPDVIAWWKDVRKVIIEGARILEGKRQYIRDNAGQTIRKTDSKGNTATWINPELSGAELDRAAIACYNAGVWPLYQISKGRDPDLSTTGKNYSADVLNRAGHFTYWLFKLSALSFDIDSMYEWEKEVKGFFEDSGAGGS